MSNKPSCFKKRKDIIWCNNSYIGTQSETYPPYESLEDFRDYLNDLRKYFGLEPIEQLDKDTVLIK
jgi:hypothetical protein